VWDHRADVMQRGSIYPLALHTYTDKKTSANHFLAQYAARMLSIAFCPVPMDVTGAVDEVMRSP
jgi:hypothetical protein